MGWSSLRDRIRECRRRKGWSQAQLAARIGVTASAVGHWERPRGTAPAVERLQDLAGVLGVGFEWLATGRGERALDCADGGEAGVGVDDVQMMALLRCLSPQAKNSLAKLLANGA